MKKLLKNRFVILFIAFVLLIVIARLSPNYSINERIIVLACGIEKETDGYLITLEAIKPNATEKTQVVSGKGVSFEAAIKKIENETGKKVSFAHCELTLIDSEVLNNGNLDCMDNKYYKVEVPELCTVLVCDKPSGLIGNKLSDVMQDTYTLGSTVRKSEGKIQPCSLKDLNKNRMTRLGAVTLPQVIYTVKEQDGEKIANIMIDSGFTFNKTIGIALTDKEYTAYLLLSEKVRTGVFNLLLSGGERVTLFVNGITDIKKYKFINDGFLTENVVKVSISHDKTDIMLENGKIIKLNDYYIDAIKQYIISGATSITDKIKGSNIDAFRLFDKYYQSYPKQAYDDFVARLSYAFSVSVVSDLS